MTFYDGIPSYQRIVSREGLDRAAQLTVIGDEQQVHDQLCRYRDAGQTDLLVTQTSLGGPEDQQRTGEFLGSITQEF